MRTPTAPSTPPPSSQPGTVTITLPTLAGIKSFFARASGALSGGQATAPATPAAASTAPAEAQTPPPAEAQTPPPPPAQALDAAASSAASSATTATTGSDLSATPAPADGKDAPGVSLASRVDRGRAKKAAIKATHGTADAEEPSNGHIVEIAGADADAVALASPTVGEASMEEAAEEVPLAPDSPELAAAGVSPLAQTVVRLRSMAAGLPGLLRRSPVATREETFVGPRPVQRRTRSLQLQPIHLILLGMIVLIVAAGFFWANQAEKVVHDPSLSVTSPAAPVLEVVPGTPSYTLRGTATPGTEIDVSIDGRDPMTTQADANGRWAYEATLHNGPNLFEIQSRDLLTNHFSQAVSFVINVPVPTASPGPMQVLVSSPTPGQVFKDGNVTITGSTVGIASLTITPTYLGAAPPVKPTPTVNPLATPTPVRTPSRTPTPTAVPTVMPTATPTLQAATAVSSPTPTPKPTPVPSGAVLPVNAIPTIDGKFSATLHLYSGRWQLTVVGSDKAGLQAAPVQVNIVVQAGSLVVVIDVRGGPVDLKIWRDGKLYIPQTRYPWGSSVRVVANQSVWVFTGIPYHTFVTVNGSYYGALGSGNKAASWRITGSGPPTPSNDR